MENQGKQKLYFLKLSKDFLQDERVRAIKLWAGGFEYFSLYIEMLVESLAQGGFIEKTGYMEDFVGDLTLKFPDYSRQTIMAGLVLFLRFGLISTDQETYCEMLQVPQMTVSETKWAQIKREQRAQLEDGEKKEEKKEKREEKKEIEENFERLWKLYPKKRGKGQVSKRAKKEIYEMGFENFKKAMMRYISEITTKGTPEQYVQMGSTFFNSGYVDYIDENYEAPKALQALQAPQAITENTNRTDQLIENIMSRDGVFSAQGLQPQNFKAEKFSEIELSRIYAVYPELRK